MVVFACFRKFGNVTLTYMQDVYFLSTLIVHEGPVTAVDISADGTKVLAGTSSVSKQSIDLDL